MKTGTEAHPLLQHLLKSIKLSPRHPMILDTIAAREVGWGEGRGEVGTPGEDRKQATKAGKKTHQRVTRRSQKRAILRVHS